MPFTPMPADLDLGDLFRSRAVFSGALAAIGLWYILLLAAMIGFPGRQARIRELLVSLLGMRKRISGRAGEEYSDA